MYQVRVQGEENTKFMDNHPAPGGRFKTKQQGKSKAQHYRGKQRKEGLVVVVDLGGLEIISTSGGTEV